MAFTVPGNEAGILPTLSAPWQQRYMHLRNSAERVAQKFPDMDTAVYTQYLSDYLNNAKKFKIVTSTETGLPIDPRAVNDQVKQAEINMIRDFDARYPIFSDSNASPGKKAFTEANNMALRRWRDEIEGPSLISRAVKSVYDEDKGGLQVSGIAGSLGGATLGYFMGSYIAGSAGAMGAGWLGTTAIVLLTGAGMMFGADVMKKVFNPPATPGSQQPSPSTPSVAQQQSKTSPAQSTEKPTREQEEAARKAADAERRDKPLESSDVKDKPEGKPITPKTHTDDKTKSEAPAR